MAVIIKLLILLLLPVVFKVVLVIFMVEDHFDFFIGIRELTLAFMIYVGHHIISSLIYLPG